MMEDTRPIRRPRSAVDKRARRVTGALDVGAGVKGYRIIDLLDEGGIGRVYRAEHTMLGHQVAIKILQSKYSDKPEHVQRFLQEALAASRIDHPSIIKEPGYLWGREN